MEERKLEPQWGIRFAKITRFVGVCGHPRLGLQSRFTKSKAREC